MRFLLDESADARLGVHLRRLGHDVTAIAVDHVAGIKDSDVLAIARREQRVLITNDRDFGELIVSQGRSHVAAILLRLGSSVPLSDKVARLDAGIVRHRYGKAHPNSAMTSCDFGVFGWRHTSHWYTCEGSAGPTGVAAGQMTAVCCYEPLAARR
jgi:predicted nuclease of predicted toxin-antitoxin system